MEWQGWWRIARRRWWLALLPPLVTAVLLFPNVILDPPAASYRVIMSYTAIQPDELDTGRIGDYQDLWLSSELVVNALTSWLQSGSFLSEMEQLTQLQDPSIELDELRLVSDNERSIGHLEIEWPDETQLRIIANAAVKVMHTRAAAYFPQLGGTSQITFLDEPQVGIAPVSLVTRLLPFVQLVLSVLIGFGFALAAEYTDGSLHDRHDLRSLGFRLLAAVPKERA